MSRKGLIAACVGAAIGGGVFGLEILDWPVFKTLLMLIALIVGILLFAGLAYAIVASGDDE